MKKIILAGGVFCAITLILIATDFSINPNSSESNLRSLDMNDSSTKKDLVLHQTEIGNQYMNPLKKSIPNSNWEESHIALERTISEENVQQNVSFEFYSEMPTPSQKVLDRFEQKALNPTLRKVPQWSSSSEINPPLEGAINVDEFLDVEKKS